MLHKTIGIIGGKGKMGQTFASFFREHGFKVLISDLKTALRPQQLAQQSDIVLISVPIDQSVTVIQQILPHLRPESALCDLTSVKVEPLKAMSGHKGEYFGLHPMFGPLHNLSGQSIILCPGSSQKSVYNHFKKLFRQGQLNVTELAAQEHDKIMSVAQGLIHFNNLALAGSLLKSGLKLSTILKFCSKSSELSLLLSARLLNQDPALYGNIQLHNPSSLKQLKAYQQTVNQLVSTISKRDLTAFAKNFQSARQYFGKNYTSTAYRQSDYLISELLKLRTNTRPLAKSGPTSHHQIAVLGPEHSYSDIITRKQLPHSDIYYAATISEVCELTQRGKVATGVVPWENKLHGTVMETVDALFFLDIHIVGEAKLPIKHCLIARPDTSPQDVTTIISHPQALNQCGKYLAKHFPKANLQESSSTSAAVSSLLQTNTVGFAAIASPEAASAHNLTVLAQNIGDNKQNVTSFVQVSKGPFEKPLPDHQFTSIAFNFDSNKPGLLFSIIREFAKYQINMTKIQSRPSKKQLGEYVFYIDFQGRTDTPLIKKVLQTIKKSVKTLKILGSY